MHNKIQAIIKSCGKQKNVNMTIKDGLKKINEVIVAIANDHNLAIEKQAIYHEGLPITEKGCQERCKIHQRF